ncbi:DUF1156 domain-containing protein [Sphaerisporangium rubeum]|uniref:Putative DNA methylase n=1 Tax=Sphaerisporangium rubeum TaxID=321317 RepID=A0A7X0IGP1_9ACTN|nr:DUF1156 domain-containing protein [Sphaerisporangium rubeum]MBB6474817.1 putative DNA methylase [Sphaerisporangium rubeum]
MTPDTGTGTPGYRRKLIEVALPLEEINKQSAREKSIRHGHPSTLHLWWARRPLAACRAVLFAQLVDDPSSRPEDFPSEEDQALERKRLFTIIERLVDWNNLNDKVLYEEAREEIRKSCGNFPPLILDPFAGGGSIPLEGQRLGLKAHASDLNPVPVLINKALIEYPTRWAGRPPVYPDVAASRLGDWPSTRGVAEDIRRYGHWMRDQAKKRIGHLYPQVRCEVGGSLDVIAWLWARTVTCPNPTCNGTLPLVRSFWLSKKEGAERYVEPMVEGRNIRFEIRGPEGAAREGTVYRGRATCLICNSPVKPDYIKSEGKAGRIGAQMMAIVAEGDGSRLYFPPTKEHEDAAAVARPRNVPDSPLAGDPRNIWCVNYGLDTFDKLFTDRQLVALATFSDLVSEVREKVLEDALSYGLPQGVPLAAGGLGALAYAETIATYLALGVSRLTDIFNSLCRWEVTKTQVRNLFTRQAIPMLWDYAETQPFGTAAGGFLVSLNSLVRSLEGVPAKGDVTVEQGGAVTRSYKGVVVSTDPPYYDNIVYSDLSDFFYVWLRRSIHSIHPDLLGTLLTPKSEELVANPYRHGGKMEATRFFENGFQQVFAHIRKEACVDYPMTVFYAFKQSESDEAGEASTGWETLLEGMIRSGWTVTATWPIRTELGNRTTSQEKNALASSIVLACRARSEDAGTIDRRGLINALKVELPAALNALQQGGIAPVDLAQAAIGPGMAVFSRYARVAEADGSQMKVRAALILINQILAEVLSEQEGDFDSDTRFCIEWFKGHGFDGGQYGDAETLSRALDTTVAGLDRARLLRARAGVVQLFSPGELPLSYDPVRDDRISVWEVVMHLAKRLDELGIEAAGQLMAAAKTRLDLDTAKELAYLLFAISNKRSWAKTALLFNSLGSAWTEIERASHDAALTESGQATIDFGDDED